MAANKAGTLIRNLASGLRGKMRILTPMNAAVAVLTAVFVLIAGWAMFANDPFGGQPVTRVSLQKPEVKTGGDNNPSAAPIRTTPASDTNDTPGRAVINLPGDERGKVVISDPISGAIDGDQTLLETSRHGPLPKIGPDGRRPMQAYARAAPALAPGQARIALVVAGMGLSAAGTEDAIRRLPSAVTFAFAPYGRDLRRLARIARTDGHELLLQVPLEPYDYPDNDPGPHTLLSGLPERQNLDRLHWVMARMVGYVGVMNHMGAKFVTEPAAVNPLLTELRNRGLLYFDDSSAPQSKAFGIGERLGLSQLKADKVLDINPARDAIDENMAAIMEVAADRGYAIGVISALPGSIAALESWISVLEQRGIAVIPLSTLVRPGAS